VAPSSSCACGRADGRRNEESSVFPDFPDIPGFPGFPDFPDFPVSPDFPESPGYPEEIQENPRTLRKSRNVRGFC
jgi:hypothetical protein